MKKSFIFFTFLACAFLRVQAQTVTDYDGNIYHVVTIGTQQWLVENLKVTHYRNGDAVPNVTDGIQWSSLTSGAFCNYDNDENNATEYGRLYNWYAISDNRYITPPGWHIPTDAEFTTLINYLGGESLAGGKLKESGLEHWLSPNTGATNESGFTALPGGNRANDGNFNYQQSNAFFWSSTELSTNYTWNWQLWFGYTQLDRTYNNKSYGYSVRCLKD